MQAALHASLSALPCVANASCHRIGIDNSDTFRNIDNDIDVDIAARTVVDRIRRRSYGDTDNGAQPRYSAQSDATAGATGVSGRQR